MRLLTLIGLLFLGCPAPAQILLEWNASTNTGHSVYWGTVANGVRITNTPYHVYFTNDYWTNVSHVKRGYVVVPVARAAPGRTFWLRVVFHSESGDSTRDIEYTIPRGPRGLSLQ